MGNLTATSFPSPLPKVSGPYQPGFSEIVGPATAAVGTPATGEKIYLGKLQSGTVITDLDYIFDDFGTSVTHDVGFELVEAVASGTVIAIKADGTKLTAVVANYWFDDKDVATAAGRSASAALPIKFLVPVSIVITQTGAVTGTPKCMAVIKGQSDGPL